MSTKWRPNDEVDNDLTEVANMLKNSDQTVQELNASLVKKYGCSLCNEVFINTYVTNCRHKFCRRCILKWLRYCRKCPECISVISKISPLKRTDAEIERIYLTLPSQYRTYREELKKKRFRAELEWKRMKMAQAALSTSQVSRMKTAVETRQSLKRSKRSKGKTRPVTTVGHSSALPQLSPKQDNEGIVRREKPGEPTTVEFIKLPPIHYQTQDSSNHFSSGSLDSSTNNYNNSVLAPGLEAFKTHQYNRDGRNELPETQFFVLNSQIPGLADASSFENVSSREMVCAGGKCRPTGQQEMAVRRLRSETTKSISGVSKGKGKAVSSVDEVEEFLSQCPVENIWESDLSTFLKLHGGGLRQNGPGKLGTGMSKTSRSSRKKQGGSGKKGNSSTTEGSQQKAKTVKADDLAKVGKNQPSNKSSANSKIIKNNQTADPQKKVSKVIRLEKNISHKKTNPNKESPNASASNPKQRGSTAPQSPDNNKEKSKAIVRSSKLELVLSDEEKRKASKFQEKQNAKKKSQNSENLSKKANVGKGSSNANPMNVDDLRKDSLEELLRKFRAERELRRNTTPPRPGTAFNSDVNRNLSELPGVAGMAGNIGSIQNQREFSTPAGPDIPVKVIQKDSPTNSRVDEKTSQRPSLQKPLSTADKNKFEKILAGIDRISTEREKGRASDAFARNDIQKSLEEQLGPRPSRTDGLPGPEKRPMESDSRKELNSNKKSAKKNSSPPQNINDAAGELGKTKPTVPSKSKKKQKLMNLENQGGKPEGKGVDIQISKTFPKFTDNQKFSVRKDPSGQKPRSKLAPDRKRPEVRKNRSRLRNGNNNNGAGRHKSSSTSGNNLESRASGEEKDNLNGTKVRGFASQPETLGVMGADKGLAGQDRTRSPDRKVGIAGKMYSIPDYPLGLVQDTEINTNAPTLPRNNIDKQDGKTFKISSRGMDSVPAEVLINNSPLP